MNSENQLKIKMMYKLYEQAMYRVAFAVLKNESEAEDIVSESFITIIKNLDKIGTPQSEETKHFVLVTIKNKSIDRYRSIAKKRAEVISIDDGECLKGDGNIEEEVINRDIISKLKINDNERKLLYLRGYEGLSYIEISERLGISADTARKRFERLKRKISKENF